MAPPRSANGYILNGFTLNGFTLNGFTLIELLVSLSLVAVLAALFSPGLFGAMPQLSLDRQTSQLQSLLQNARTLALTEGISAFACPANALTLNPDHSTDGDWCDLHRHWGAGVNVVLDRNRDGQPGSGDALALHLNWRTVGLGHAPMVSWRSFRNSHHIEFLPSGMTNWHNGRFLLCSPDTNVLGNAVVLNAAGRSYRQRLQPSDCSES
jgi:type IV fimbrial biogenesis protein FimT